MQDLVVVIKDWCDETFGYCWAEEYKRHMLSEDCSDGQAKAFFQELEHCFRSVHVFLSPIPNQEVMSRQCPVQTMEGGFFLTAFLMH